jgi:hypothetical protein
MYYILHQTWIIIIFLNVFLFHGLGLSQYDVSIAFLLHFWYGNAIPLQVSKDIL